jgi:hypothetical protein
MIYRDLPKRLVTEISVLISCEIIPMVCLQENRLPLNADKFLW